MEGLAATPEPPYYAVIFTSRRTEAADGEDYARMSARMVELAARQEGYLGIESVRDANGTGITVSYWRDEPSIRRWKAHVEHAEAQARGKIDWYPAYELRVAKVERTVSFRKP